MNWLQLFLRSSRKLISAALVCVVAGLLLAAPATAATVLSNAGNGGVGFLPIVFNESRYATAFTVPAGQTYRLNSVTLSLRRAVNLNASATVTLNSDNAGSPGNALATVGTVNPGTTSFSSYTATNAGGLTLNGGTTYWLVVTGTNLIIQRSTATPSGTFTYVTTKSNLLSAGWFTALSSMIITVDADAYASVSSITRAAASPTNAASVSWNVSLSRTVTGLTTSNFALAASGVSGASITGISGGGAAWTVTASTGTGDGTLGLNLANATNVIPGISTALPFTGEVYTIDKTAPTVSMSSAAPDPTNTSPIPVTVTFSENVSGFTAAAITAINGTVSNFTGSGANYSFDLIPSGQGLVTADIPAGVATDGAGNSNVAATQFSRTYDGAAPTVAISSTATDPTSVSPIAITVTFSENVSGFDLTDVTVTNGVASNYSGTGAIYTFDVTPAGAGLVTVNVGANVAQDSAGNGNVAAPPFSITFDSDAPGATISSTASNPTNLSPIPITVTFTEDVTGFSTADVVITNGTISNFAGGPAVYTFDVTPAAFGTVTVDVPAGVAQDSAMNGNTAAASFNIGYGTSGIGIIYITMMNDGADAATMIPNPLPAYTPAFSIAPGSPPAASVDAATGAFIYAFDPGAALGLYTATVDIIAGGQAFSQIVEITMLEAAPPVPLCEATNFDENSVVRAGGISDAIKPFINCRVLYANGAATSWLGSPMYSEANLGVPGLMELGLLQAVDVFSPAGMTYFEGGAVFCLRGTGTLIWLAASQAPRVPAVVQSYTVEPFPGFTCVTLFEPGTLVLVSDNPIDQ